MNLMLHIVLCGVLIAIVVALYIYHHWLENHEDHYIHLHNDSHDASIINNQAAVGKRVETVGKLKNAGLIAVIVYALAIAGMAIYAGWNSSATTF